MHAARMMNKGTDVSKSSAKMMITVGRRTEKGEIRREENGEKYTGRKGARGTKGTQRERQRIIAKKKDILATNRGGLAVPVLFVRLRGDAFAERLHLAVDNLELADVLERVVLEVEVELAAAPPARRRDLAR